MPITAKLSRTFYERLGDEVVNELAEWLNAVDSGYRQEFRELFDARFGHLDERMATLEARMAGFESRIEARMAAFEVRVDARLAAMDARFPQLESRIDAKLEALKAELLRWLFLFWIGSIGTVIALLKL